MIKERLYDLGDFLMKEELIAFIKENSKSLMKDIPNYVGCIDN